MKKKDNGFKGVKYPVITGVDDPMVNQPHHYADSEIECIDAMVAAFGQDKVNTYTEIAAFKYIWRMNKKRTSSTQDKQKAVWYLRYSMNDDPRIKK
tara:strand:- start:5860 stop:6147 length:288 start_codon:yes stop_codon:yes gene_type:complete